MGEEPGQLFFRRHQLHLRHYGADVRATGAAAEIGDRWRETGSRSLTGGAAEPEESAADLRKRRSGTDSRDRQLFPERRARSVQGRERPGAAEGIPSLQPEGDGRAQELSAMDGERPEAAGAWRLSPGRRQLSQEAAL